jgi:hypothetical protein
VVHNPDRHLALPQAQLLGAAEESQEVRTAHPKRYPVKAGRRAVPLGLALEQRELGPATIGRDHERTAGVRSPLLRAGQRRETQDLGVPIRRSAAVGYEQLYVVDLRYPKRHLDPPTPGSVLTPIDMVPCTSSAGG